MLLFAHVFIALRKDRVATKELLSGSGIAKHAFVSSSL